MVKYKVLILGHSDLAKKKIIKTFIKHNVKFSVASKSEKNKIVGAYAQFKTYEEGLKKSSADIVYISLPNSFHYKWAKKALNCGCHVIVDKPICENIDKIKNLINLAKKSNKLLSEAIFFDYHKQISLALKLSGGIKKIRYINTNFIIPKPKINNFRNSKKLKGDVLMDMGCYASSVANIFCERKIYSKKIILKKNDFNLINSLNFIFDFSTQIYTGQFKYGGEYQNNLNIYTDKKIIQLDRVFSPPDNETLNLLVKEKNIIKTYKIKKENVFEKYFLEVIEKISKRKYQYYFEKMININKFVNLLKK
tara:strand:- start:128 stop:1051 length:924 start_codon:yes stop_codon:yes gene_type:complete